MSTIYKSAQSTPLSSLSPLNSESRDGGALELGAESAWTRDDTFVTGVERSDSLEVEPSAGDLLSAVCGGGALGAPQNSSTPLHHVDDVVHSENSLDAGVGLDGSTPMNTAPLLGSVNGQRPSMLFSTVDNEPEINVNHSPSVGHLSNAVSWADLPDDDEIGKRTHGNRVERLKNLGFEQGKLAELSFIFFGGKDQLTNWFYEG
jgi:hypothetical protein